MTSPASTQPASTQPASPPGTVTQRLRQAARQLSAPVTVLAGGLFAAGVAGGGIAYLGRSPVRQAFVPGSSAWWQQSAVAAVTCVVFGYAWWRHQRRPGPRSGGLWLLAPLGAAAARRVAATASGALRSLPGLIRALAALPPALLFCYGFFRAGLQVIGGLDPNATVNAWGGPTYIGALACHYLDLILIAGACGWLLDRILLPDRG
jgi:hypothetical protein